MPKRQSEEIVDEADADDLLTPQQAQAVVSDRIDEFGLGALPSVRVDPRADGHWRITWTTHVALCPPMSMRQWKAWLERYVGPLSPERLQTTEG
jgi:hypothetical protein